MSASRFASPGGLQREPTFALLLAAVALLAGPFAPSLAAQDEAPATIGDGERDRIRIGVSLGGTGFLGLVTEYQHGDWAAEFVLGTLSFRELSMAVAGKRYFASGKLRPAIGIGLWKLAAWTENGSGSALIARVPLAIDWSISGAHAVGVEVGLNRAISVKRLDPDDDTPASTRIVPFPGFYYRYGWNP
ncbi:MAG: hypothetical protein EXR92_05545 [Gemmatimonadetes bacterium]|nr:hypothetical protein [Gemmatimonadota bacterium]